MVSTVSHWQKTLQVQTLFNIKGFNILPVHVLPKSVGAIANPLCNPATPVNLKCSKESGWIDTFS